LEIPLEPVPRHEPAATSDDARTAARLPPASPDHDLVSGALQRRAPDVERFIERMGCIPRILGVVNARMGSPLSPEDLADLAQDALIIVWRKLATYDGRTSLESWAYGIAWFELHNAARRKRRLPTPLEDVQDLRSSEAPAVQSGFDEERIRIGLSRLEAAEATILRMRHFDELTFEEAAARLGISVSAAKSRYYRGLEKLRTLLGSRVEDPPR
jgi:RNA polymerase sigma-70 factor (ECF subfamily)